MTSKIVKEKLRQLGFEYDEDVTGKHPIWTHWTGTIDPIGAHYIAGDNCCMGHTVEGSSRAEMDKEAMQFAAEFSDQLIPCADPECEIHGD